MNADPDASPLDSIASENGLELPLEGTQTLAELFKGDRLLRMRVLTALALERGHLPDDLLDSVKTVDDLRHLYDNRLSPQERPVDPELDEWPHRTNRIHLRSVSAEDLELIYRLSNDARTSYRWSMRGRTVSRGEMAQAVAAGAHCQYVVARNSDYRAVGLVSLTDYSSFDRRADLTVVGLRNQTQDSGAFLEVFEGTAAFLSYCFRTFGLRKITASIPGWNWQQFAGGVDQYFVVEGVLRDHDEYDGRFWDRRLISFFAPDWNDRVAPSLRQAFAAFS